MADVRPGDTPARWFARVLDGPQLRRIGVIAFGTAAGQGSMLLASPLLTRIYLPADFGLYAYYFAALGLLAPVATLRYELAIPVPASDDDAWQLARISLIAALAVTVATAIVLASAVAAGMLTTLDRDLRWLAVVLPVGLLLAGVVQTLTYVAVRLERFGAVARSRASTGIVAAITQLSLGMISPAAAGLYGGDLLARGASAAPLGASARTIFRSGTSPGRLRQMARSYIGFAVVSTPSTLMNGAASFLPIVAAGYMYGAAAAGWLFMAQRVISFPTSMLMTASSQVYIAEFVRLGGRQRMRLYRETLERLAFVGGVPVLLTGALAPLLFGFVFGEEWRAAGVMAAALAPLYMLQLLSGSTIGSLEALGRHRARLGRELVLLILVAGIFMAAHLLQWSLLQLVVAYGVTGAVFYLGSILLVYMILKAET